MKLREKSKGEYPRNVTTKNSKLLALTFSEYAQEFMPESFIATTMLYIDLEVSKIKFQAFVDSGAQSTIISQAFAERCGLMKHVDKRFHGTAVGVGTSKIIGRIHTAKLKLDDEHEIECALQVLDNIDIDFLFGLDMLKKHRVRSAVSYPSVRLISTIMCSSSRSSLSMFHSCLTISSKGSLAVPDSVIRA